ncbi:hypothetical protein GCM10009097_15020 [Pigmentiphaga daeguensis]|uniref:Uncharacterized protein n=1 Tax=Pigmentiphaga daeguensis TaxID=414049 RepID=A0ABN1BK15_9BURK
MAALTFSSVAGETCCGVLMARDTVIIETPAAWATSRTVTRARSAGWSETEAGLRTEADIGGVAAVRVGHETKG